MSSSIDHSGAHYALPPNQSTTDHSSKPSSSSASSSQYALPAQPAQQHQQQQQPRHLHHSHPPPQQHQHMFYAPQDYHQQPIYPSRQSSQHPPLPQQQPSRHTNDQYPPPPPPPQQQDLPRQSHYNQHHQQPQQPSSFGYNTSHYQDLPATRSHYTPSAPGHGHGHSHPPVHAGGHHHERDQEATYPQDTNSRSASAAASSPPRSENGSSVRFKVTLEAPTAAMQRQDETSLTYLNKAQFYTIGLEDTEEYNGEITSVIKVTFHEASHRRLAARYWSFWLSQQPNPKSARALDIEKASSTGILEVQSKTFDRISFKWNGKAGAKLMVRFNCLSTDFSRIKGVKGIPLRVHMDTMLDGIGSKDGANGHRSRSRSSGDSPAMERAFAKIKLFRDKGAERKNKDDQKQLEKMWDKMRGKNADTNPLISMLAPVQNVSIFSECTDPPEGSAEDETLDLSEIHDSHEGPGPGSGTSSGRQGSVDDGDDGSDAGGADSYPSRHDGDSSSSLSNPAAVPGDASSNSAVVSNRKRRRTDDDGLTMGDHGDHDHSTLYDPQQSQVGLTSSASSVTSGSGAPTVVGDGVPLPSSTPSSSDPFLDRELAYVPNPQQTMLQAQAQQMQARKRRAVLCLYIRIGGEAVYRAVYLEKYTLADLTQKLSEKLEIQSSTISNVYRKTLKKELIVKVDDTMVAQMPDELDMIVEYEFNQQDGSVTLTLKY